MAMAMYAVSSIPVIRKVSCDVKQVWSADDATAAGQLKSLRQWWNNLVSLGPDFGYFVNHSKTSLIVQEQRQRNIFKTVNSTWEQP